ncbi:Outer membrane cobalamin receptor protein [Arachidicoccus rhizosphaerae]|uniref:Outer membrane cobalamin receptor protein n=1 Tax=Arachidicoccus rhizosphaerae TaxID=551991 RepID=A0A1H3W7D1_9BACT|nr:TonB-dependent receptor plug domain-containing protein [Arachidicoccus rhizosphaerae]SDZ82900.1 Outer membrane cobalamin receptor protein [Arachidicoccus rhizosphaerae]
MINDNLGSIRKISSFLAGWIGLCIFILLSGVLTAQSSIHSLPTRNKNTERPVADTSLPFNDSANILQDVNLYTTILPAVISCIDPIQVITRKYPVWQDGLSVSDMVRYFSGVQLKDYGGVGGLKTVDVRSLGTRHTAVLMDGLPLENAQNGQVDLGKYGLNDLSSISIYKNQNSQIFQPATAFASSNAIYLESRMESLDSLRPQKGSLSMGTGSFGLYNGSFYGAKRLSNLFQIEASVDAMTTKGDYPYTYTNGVYDTTLKRNNGDVKRFNGKLSLYGHFEDSSALSVIVYGFRRQMGLPGAIVSNKFTNKERQDESDFYGQTSYFKPVGTKDKIKVQFKYNYNYLKYSNPEINKLYLVNGDTIKGVLANHYRQSSYFFSAANLYQILPGWDLDLSADVHYDHLRMDLNGLENPYRWTYYGAIASYVTISRVQLAGNLLYTNVRDHQQINDGIIGKQKLSPAFSASWQPFEGLPVKFRSFFKKSFQMPTFNDLYLTQYNQTELRPENSEQYSLGISYYKGWSGLFKNLQLELDGYYNEVKDKIVAIPTTSLFRWQMVNLGLAKIKGLEFTAKSTFELNGWLLLSTLEYTYQDARDYTKPGSVTYKNELPYIPRHSGSFILSILKDRFGMNYSFIYDGERYSERFNSLVSYVPAWYTHDVSFNYRLPIKGPLTSALLLSVDNVFNQHYDVIENYPMPGRNFKIGVQFDF